MIPYSALSVLLSSMEPDRPMWRTPDGQIIRAEQLEALPQKYKNAVAGRSVALRARHSVGCASFMLALDGVADSIVFLPMSLSPKALALIVEQTKPDFLLSDDAAADASLGLPVLTAQPQSPSLPEIDATSTAQAKTRWIIPTSGTTATPKLVVHTLASLTRTVNVNRLAGKQYRWGSLYNLMGFAGLQVFFQSWFGGSCLLMTDDATPLSERVAQLAQGGCTALSATPTMWRKILMTPAACRLELKQVTLGGEIVPQQVLDALRAQYPTARLTHIYASTEAGVGFAVKDGKEGFPASLVENPPQGLSIRISAAGHLLLRSDCDDQTYADTARHLRDEDGFIDTGDVVLHQGDRFRFQGRADGRINVGGNKVYPEEVERVLSTFPGVAMVVVGSIQSSLVGELVEAKVVVASPLADASEFRRQLLQHCRNHLAPFKVPAIVNFVDSLSINSNGKVLRASRSEESKS